MIYKPEIIRLLIAHDSQDEAEQLMNVLRNAGRATVAELVLDESSFLETLKTGHWDLLLTRPEFGDCELSKVMVHLQRLGKILPVITLEDEVNAESMARSMEIGATAVAPYDHNDLVMLQIDQALKYVKVRRERQQVELALREAEKRLSVLMDHSRDAIAYVVDGMHIHANEVYLEMFGYDDPDDLAGIPIMDVVASDDQDKFKELLKRIAREGNNSHEAEFTGVNAQGEEFTAHFAFSPSSYDEEDCIQIVIRSSSADEKELQSRLAEISQVDQTTGLYNHRWFIDRLDDSLGAILEQGGMKALFYLRIDEFDHHQGAVGLDGGDDILIAFAENLKEQAGKNATLARIGGEEFCVMLPVQEPDDAHAFGERLRQSVQDLMPAVKGRTLHLTTSIGVAFVREDSRNSQSIMTLALDCCNRASTANGGKGNAIHVHDPLDDVEAGSEEAIALILEKALEEQRFRVLFQPIVKLGDDGYAFQEVFVELPQGTDEPALRPDKFMAVAANKGIAGKVDRMVISKALSAAAKMEDKPRLMINITGFSLQDGDLAGWLEQEIQNLDYAADLITFQITEFDANNFLKQAQSFKHEINQLGCQFSISQFAGNLNPMQLLEHLSVDLVKFDPAFSQQLAGQEGREKISNIIAQVKDKQTQVLISYIESAQQMQATWMLGGVDFIQGYYIQPPTASLQADD